MIGPKKHQQKADIFTTRLAGVRTGLHGRQRCGNSCIDRQAEHAKIYSMMEGDRARGSIVSLTVHETFLKTGSTFNTCCTNCRNCQQHPRKGRGWHGTLRSSQDHFVCFAYQDIAKASLTTWSGSHPVRCGRPKVSVKFSIKGWKCRQ